MKILVILFMSVFILTSCEERFAGKKYDVLFTVKNATDETLNLSINEINERIHWEKTLSPDEIFEIKFNIKEEIKSPEGGFIFKATFPDGESVEKNTGYYTNYQIGWKNPQHYKITKDSILMTDAE